MPHQRRYFISALEPSGDLIGASLAKELGDQIVSGLGGETLQQAGVRSLYNIQDLAILGVMEVLPKISLIRRRLNETVEFILKENITDVITIDAYSFHIRLAKKLRKRGYTGRLIQIVAPSVWAWNPSRSKTLSRYYNRLLCLLPFEPQYFTPYGLDARFVGHPAYDRIAPKRNPIPGHILLLPGSRTQELDQLLPIFMETAHNLQKQYPHTQITIPTLPHLEERIQKQCAIYHLNANIVTTSHDKEATFNTAQIALAASGTASVELALYQIPMIIAYKVNPITYTLGRWLVRVPTLTLVNILLKTQVIPEFIQQDCTSEKLTHTLSTYLEDPAQLHTQTEAFPLFAQALRPPAPFLTVTDALMDGISISCS